MGVTLLPVPDQHPGVPFLEDEWRSELMSCCVRAVRNFILMPAHSKSTALCTSTCQGSQQV
jgi:hypothetical protein